MSALWTATMQAGLDVWDEQPGRAWKVPNELAHQNAERIILIGDVIDAYRPYRGVR